MKIYKWKWNVVIRIRNYHETHMTALSEAINYEDGA